MPEAVPSVQRTQVRSRLSGNLVDSRLVYVAFYRLDIGVFDRDEDPGIDVTLAGKSSTDEVRVGEWNCCRAARCRDDPVDSFFVAERGESALSKRMVDGRGARAELAPSRPFHGYTAAPSSVRFTLTSSPR
ncbi:hypothetical protein GCM10028857_30070 [Salinarchaeum chitinilyticum]